MQFKLANIVLNVGDFLAGHEGLLWRSVGVPGVANARAVGGAVANKKDGETGGTGDNGATKARGCAASATHAATGVFEFTGMLDLLTYFNAFSLTKWRQYTSLENLFVHVELSGDDCDIVLARTGGQASALGSTKMAGQAAQRVGAQGAGQPNVQTEVLANMYASAQGGWQSFDLAIALDDSVLVGLQLASAGTSKVRNAYFYTDVPQERVRPVRLALATTTFNNEAYILPNIELIKCQVLGSVEPIARAFHMFVVDNGQSLDAEALSGRGITVVSNPNVGGAGGFARGMLEALGEGVAGKPEGPFTHVLLMDDDVRVFPESFIRTFNLLSLVNDQYKDAFVQGAMLKLQEPSMQFEDVSFAKRSGGYWRYKETTDISLFENMVVNEATSVEGAQSYGAWWYSCMPVSAIREHGLPLPLFIRIDDVEYGMRCRPTYMCMGGICVWHSQFVGRFRASVDGYQYARNMLIAIACDGFASEQAFMAKYWRNFNVYMRFMAYETAELWLDALEDYLRGPEWLAAVDGAKLMKENAAKNEKLVPITELDVQVMAQLDINQDWLGHEELQRSVVVKAAEALPYSRHLLPKLLLKNTPAMVDYSGSLSPWYATARRRILVALDATGKNGHVRTLDRARYKQLRKRYKNLRVRYAREKRDVAQAYRSAMPYLTSVDFWKEYLGI